MTDGSLIAMAKKALQLVLVLLCAATASAQGTTGAFEKEVAAFEAADRKAPPPIREIVFVGSSTIANWDMARYLPNLRVINRGIPGSSLADTVRLVPRLVLPYQPRIVVLYAGENDIDSGRTSEEVAVLFERFAKAVHSMLPATRILYIGLKPSIQRWLIVDRMRAANLLVRAICTRDDRLAMLDVDAVMLGWNARPRRELFVEDGLHLSPQGYQLWTTLLRPFLLP
jgi:lysophospholipase L1-like esterase